MSKFNKEEIEEIKFLISTNIPLSSYFSSVFLSIISIICGTALGILFTVVYDELYKVNDYILFWKVFNIFITIGVIWHQFIVHNQFVAWNIGISDTMNPFILGGLLMLLILYIKDDIIPLYFFTFLSYASLLSYIMSLYKIKRNKNLIINRLKHILKKKKFYYFIYASLITFNKKILILFTLTSIVLSIILYLIMHYSYIFINIYLFLYTIFIIYIGNLNFTKYLEIITGRNKW